MSGALYALAGVAFACILALLIAWTLALLSGEFDR